MKVQVELPAGVTAEQFSALILKLSQQKPPRSPKGDPRPKFHCPNCAHDNPTGLHSRCRVVSIGCIIAQSEGRPPIAFFPKSEWKVVRPWAKEGGTDEESQT